MFKCIILIIFYSENEFTLGDIFKNRTDLENALGEDYKSISEGTLKTVLDAKINLNSLPVRYISIVNWLSKNKPVIKHKLTIINPAP